MGIISKRTAAVTVIFLVIVALTLAFIVWRNNVNKIIPIPTDIGTVEARESVIGRSLQGREIKAFTFGQGQKKLTLVGGIHGGYEWNTVLLAYKFIDYFTADRKNIPENLTITVIPILNPDGLFQVTKKEGRFTLADIPADLPNGTGRFNARQVDLNRNFDCKWQATSTWKSKAVSAGTAPFSEPEASAIQSFVTANRPDVMIFFHSQSNALYASACEKGILPETLNILDAYARFSGYPVFKTFDNYVVTGAVEDWLASINIPAISVELATHESVEWEKNLAGVKSLFDYLGK